jgi:hypothetical protein
VSLGNVVECLNTWFDPARVNDALRRLFAVSLDALRPYLESFVIRQQLDQYDGPFRAST